MRAIVVSALALVACGGAHSQATPDGGGSGGADGPTGGHVESASLPQTIGGAAWVDTAAYLTIPVHVAVVGDAATVSVSVDGAATAASPAASGGGEWIAMVPVASLADGEHQLTATATGGDRASAMVGATLVAGRAGMQWTQVGTDGLADTPRLLRLGDTLAITWTDQSDGTRSAWLEPIDGAGRSAGARVRLAGGAGKPDVLAARTVHGASSIAVLYQQPGGAYQNWLTIVSETGATTLAPMALDPAGRYGSWGGDITFDGTAFLAVWRTNDGAAHDDVRWIRIDEASGAITGPFVVAASGNDDPDAGFDPFTFIGVRPAGEAAGSVVAFLRYEHDPVLATDVPKCQLASVSDAGTVTATSHAEVGTGLLWDHECRVLGSKPVLLWGASDLTSSATNPPVGFFAAPAPGGDLPASRGDGHLVVSAADNRTEPALIETAAAAPTLAWLDERTYVNPQSGRIELYTAPLGADLTAGAPIVFEHAHFVEGTSELGGAAVGTNAILSWIDERHGGTITNPRPEVYLETVWQ
jgi:hypothetical protein